MKSISLLLCGLVLFVAPLWAGSDSERAREIAQRPEYHGYRIVSGEYTVQGSEGGTEEALRERPRRFEREARESRFRRAPGAGMPQLSVGAIGNGLFWVLLVGAGVVVLILVARVVMDAVSRRSRRVRPEVATEAVAVGTEDPRAGIEAELREALFRGEIGTAMLARYRLFWFDAGWRGCLSVYEVRTWRDSLGMIDEYESRARMGKLLCVVECVRYGHHAPSRAEYETWERELSAVKVKLA